MTTPIRLMSRRELEQLISEAKGELNARRRANTDPDEINAQITRYQKEQGRQDGEEWEQPVTALDAYRKDAEVTYDGETWRSLRHANPHRPGVALWRLVPEADEDGNEIPPRYVQPSSAADAYEIGDRITHNGQIWEAVRDGVVHSPDEYAPDWQLIEPEPEPDPEPPEDQGPVDPKPDDDQPAEWEQRYGHNPYNTGDRVLWHGSVYESVIDGNTWSPTDHPQGWTQVD